MLTGRNNLDYEYFNRYLKNCGYNDISEMELLNDFFKERLNIPQEHELDPEKVIFLNELVSFVVKNNQVKNLKIPTGAENNSRFHLLNP